jgi:hypothetical protein
MTVPGARRDNIPESGERRLVFQARVRDMKPVAISLPAASLGS